MQKITRLSQILSIKEQATNKARDALLQAQNHFNKTKNQHSQLINYRQDYLQQISDIGNQGCTISKMRNRVNFISEVDRALMQLNQRLSDIASQRKNHEKDYLHAKAEEEALKSLISRLKIQEQRRQDKLEQKEMDEYAAKQWYSKKKKQ
ncbi:MAG: flagellar export protein FliJ [Proteobacteria bacterium]|nr:flagellar export protein FliJ [Pseudomonadota bacterium]